MIDIDFLKSRGYMVAESTKQKMTHEEVMFNLLGYFEHYPKFDFWFVQYRSRRVRISRDGMEGMVFGKCKFGYLIEDNSGAIRLISFDNNSDEDLSLPDLIIVNTDIQGFYKCYMTFLTAVYHLKSHIFESDDSYLKILEETCNDLRRKLARINNTSVSDDSFWGLLIYMLEDNYFPISLHLSDYSEAGEIEF